MPTSLTPMNELEAINDMLSLIAETPLASLDEVDGVADAQIARQILSRVNRAVQQKGWHWNTEEDYSLAPDVSGNIILPSNTLNVDPSDPSADYVARAGKLWDRTEHTFTFTAPVRVELRLLYAFEDLPAVARTYIATLAGSTFEARMQGDTATHQINQSDVLAAYAALLEDEADNAEYNVIKDSPSINFRTRNREVY